jgi:hypothetical protein
MSAVRIPPLVLSAPGSIGDRVVDRLALHLRAKFPHVFGDKTLDEIALMFTGLRDEVDRMCPQREQEDW